MRPVKVDFDYEIDGENYSFNGCILDRNAVMSVNGTPLKGDLYGGCLFFDHLGRGHIIVVSPRRGNSAIAVLIDGREVRTVRKLTLSDIILVIFPLFMAFLPLAFLPFVIIANLVIVNTYEQQSHRVVLCVISAILGAIMGMCCFYTF